MNFDDIWVDRSPVGCGFDFGLDLDWEFCAGFGFDFECALDSSGDFVAA